MAPVVAIGIGSLATWLIWRGAGSYSGTSSGTTYGGSVTLNPTAAASMGLIVGAFLARGLSIRAAHAAVVNAYAESALNPAAVGDSGHSVGLFQINDLSGRRSFNGDRKDPSYNISWILDNEVMAAAGSRFRAMDAAGASLGDLVEAFCRDIERPFGPNGDAVKRRAYAVKLFPGEV